MLFSFSELLSKSICMREVKEDQRWDALTIPEAAHGNIREINRIGDKEACLLKLETYGDPQAV
jgi:hypothetical protein